jgi:hypothetical protein
MRNGTPPKGRWGGVVLIVFFARRALSRTRLTAHVAHELANILVTGDTLGADLRGSLSKLLAYRRFDGRRLPAPQLSEKCSVYTLVYRIPYDSHCMGHCRRSNFAALLLSTLALQDSIHRRGKQ